MEPPRPSPYLSCQTVPSRSYTLFYQTNLLALGNIGWLASPVADVAGNGETLSYTNPVPGISNNEHFLLLEAKK